MKFRLIIECDNYPAMVKSLSDLSLPNSLDTTDHGKARSISQDTVHIISVKFSTLENLTNQQQPMGNLYSWLCLNTMHIIYVYISKNML